MLRSDGRAVVPISVIETANRGRTLLCRGCIEFCVIEPDSYSDGTIYSQISAGGSHVVLLQSDGRAEAFGDDCPCWFPELEAGVTYTQVSAGQCHTILLRSDGRVAAVGYDSHGECSLADGVLCGWQTNPAAQIVVLLSAERDQSTAADGRIFACYAVSGQLLGHVDVSLGIRPHQLVYQVAKVVGMSQRVTSVKLILPDGKLLRVSNTFPLADKSPTHSRSRSPRTRRGN